MSYGSEAWTLKQEQTRLRDLVAETRARHLADGVPEPAYLRRLELEAERLQEDIEVAKEMESVAWKHVDGELVIDHNPPTWEPMTGTLGLEE